jgi:hypothetical protein
MSSTAARFAGSIVETRPATAKTVTVVGDTVHASKVKAEDVLETVKVCTSD